MTVPATAAASPARSPARSAHWARGAAGLLGVFLALEAIGRAGIVSEESFPPASTVVVEAVKLLGDGGFMDHLAATLVAWVSGLVLTIAIAVPLGLLLGSIPLVNEATRAIVEFLRPIPSVALVPLASLLLDPGLELKVVLIVYGAGWPVLYNTIYGLRDVDPLAKQTLRSFGFGRFAVLARVSLPSAAPFIFTGIRLASSVALILAISVEILSGRGEGVGKFIVDASSAADQTDLVLAGTFWAGVLGLLFNALLVRGERRLFRWHHAHRPGQS